MSKCLPFFPISSEHEKNATYLPDRDPWNKMFKRKKEQKKERPLWLLFFKKKKKSF